MDHWGTFTARGGSQIENRIRQIMEEAAQAMREVLHPSEYLAVVLIGGYGRGEGGVLEVDGKEQAHNNFDFLIISPGRTEGRSLKERADRALAPLIIRYEIGMDVGYVSETQLARSACLVMWYDMRFGHKTILGRHGVVSDMRQFSVDRIIDSDIRNLLVNRGTLLVINELLLQKKSLRDSDKKLLIRHAIKAIIGYGDALLFFHGKYHFSYEEKQRRMQNLDDVCESFRTLYDDAMEFRFRPKYTEYIKRDLAELNSSLCKRLAPIHLECERKRLDNPMLDWNTYADRAFSYSLMDQAKRPRAIAKKTLAFCRGRFPKGRFSVRAKLGYRTSDERERLSLLFPAVVYELAVPSFNQLAQESLGASGSTMIELGRAYLRAWAADGDLNFQSVVNSLELKLENPS